MRAATAVLVLILVGWIVAPAIWELVLPHEASAALRGRRRAGELGCFSCHGAEGRGGVANPGSKRETIPGFTGSTLMMYVHDDQEIREYVLDGKPKRLADDPDHEAELKAQAIAMPAYRKILSPAEVDLLVAYIRSVSGLVAPHDEPAATGADVAQRMGCAGCHGALGIGGRDNPGSLKGYIPGFTGADFRDLVRSDEELREWIREGSLERIDRHWIGGHFARRQLIKMPAFKHFASDAEVEALAAWVRWISSGGADREPLS